MIILLVNIVTRKTETDLGKKNSLLLILPGLSQQTEIRFSKVFFGFLNKLILETIFNNLSIHTMSESVLIFSRDNLDLLSNLVEEITG